MNAPAQKILVVEDENIVAMDLRTTLTRLGYEVVDTVVRPRPRPNVLKIVHERIE